MGNSSILNWDCLDLEYVTIQFMGSEAGTPVADDLYPKFAAGSLTWFSARETGVQQKSGNN